MSNKIEIIVGTYEEFLVGYTLNSIPGEDGKKVYSLEQSFANHAHTGSVRAVTRTGKYLVSGSADNGISLINMKLRTEHGSLKQQEGIITCLEGFSPNYLFSGCEDGSICIWKAGSWTCEKTLKAHKGGVLGISIHPSGKLALSIGKDRTIKTWNLIKGRHAFITNLKVVPDVVKFSPKGTSYAVSINDRVDVYSIQTAQVVYSFKFGKRTNCISFLKEDVMVVGGDKESIEVHSISKSKLLSSFEAHKPRVKDLQYLPDKNLLVSVSNDGYIKVWKFKKNDEEFTKVPKLLTQVNVGCRIICLEIFSESILADAPNPEEEGVAEEEVEILSEVEGDEVMEIKEEDEDSDEEMEEDLEDEEEEEEEKVQEKKKSEPIGFHGKSKRKKIQ